MKHNMILLKTDNKKTAVEISVCRYMPMPHLKSLAEKRSRSSVELAAKVYMNKKNCKPYEKIIFKTAR